LQFHSSTARRGLRIEATNPNVESGKGRKKAGLSEEEREGLRPKDKTTPSDNEGKNERGEREPAAKYLELQRRKRGQQEGPRPGKKKSASKIIRVIKND